MTLPDPDTLHPLPEHPRVVALRPLAKDRPNVTVGPFAYYDDPEHATEFFTRNVLHHHDFIGDRLTIGGFAAIATGVRIVMNGANHLTTGFSTYPFEIHGGAWAKGFDPSAYAAGLRGDTVIGPDVWIGMEAVIMPGVTIGAGAIVAARSVVTHDVAPFAVVAGNPARPVRQRFDEETVARLLAVAWWDWPSDRIARNLRAIRGTDITALEAAE
ncbi:CatB-related O-acetyltransferase [Halovulum dunhuangense]|uniref:CatB-related O-acetyltransferase n=1 Tax=Halovulum dunhuangense TaxID=1505036 RepID=A0A849L0M8_9RHOB|nr:CatB-related O-acetyltransferase [Halovulum dunhuangense]NNU79817.1 CatB-related O-acetyltransferase [Halovulum dunhuangense]